MRFWIDATEIRAFVGITSIATEREVLGVILTAMLLCDDVFDLE